MERLQMEGAWVYNLMLFLIISMKQKKKKKHKKSSLHGDVQPETPKYTWRVCHLALRSNHRWCWVKHVNDSYVLISNVLPYTQMYATKE